MAVAAEAGIDVELISYGHTVIQAANLHVALAFGRTTYFEQAVPVEPWEHGVRNPIHTGPDGRAHVPHGTGLGIELTRTWWKQPRSRGRRRRSAMTIGTDDQEGRTRRCGSKGEECS